MVLETNVQSQTSQARTSVRYSTYSVTPSMAGTVQTTDSATAEIHDIEQGLNRMENKALSSQRVELSEEKTANMSKLALGAKLERALDRRMSSQDAVFRRKKPAVTNSEKQGTAELKA
jgi:hypothetical protein